MWFNPMIKAFILFLSNSFTRVQLKDPVMDWRPARVHPASRPAGIGSSPPTDMKIIQISLDMKIGSIIST